MFDFIAENTPIEGCLVIRYDHFSDIRGSICSNFIHDKIHHLTSYSFLHDKTVVSNKNVLRGIHYDPKTVKLVTCVYGNIQQVVVDLRADSPTYKKSFSVDLHTDSYASILIPAMCGNAFYVRSELSVYNYKLSYPDDYLDADQQFTTKWDDPELAIEWCCSNPVLSGRDS